MEKDNKYRVVKEYDRLDIDIKEQLKLVYPEGFSNFLLSYVDKEGKRVSALRFETDDKIYLIKMTAAEAEDIIEQDDDYDEDGNLKDGVQSEYEDKHSDIDYLSENENYNDPF